MLHGLTQDEFYLRRYIAPILPVAMLSAGCSGLLLWLLRTLSGASLGWTYELLILGGDATMIALAWLCRRFARAGRLHPASLTIVAYGGVFSLTVTTRTDLQERGLLTLIPALMIIILIGSMFALRLWHLLLGYAVTLAPGWWYARHVSPQITTEGENFTSAALFTLATAITFYLLASRIRRYFFGVLEEHDDRAQRDPLTGMLNRTAWYERAAAAAHLADVAGNGGALLYIDVDHFKRINDDYGHARGDDVLVQVAACLRAAMPADALIARFGGEEFVVLRGGCGLDAAREDAEGFRAALRGIVVPGVAPTVSIGVACRQPGEGLDALLQRADTALLRAKRLGRDRVEVDDGAPSSAPILAGVSR